MSADRPAVLVYRRDYLALSETFIKDHIEGLRRWQPVVAYDHRVAGLVVHGVEQVSTMPRGRNKWRAFNYKYLGINRDLTEVVRRHRIRLVHAHFLTDGVQIARFARRAGLPLLVTAHGYDATIWDHEQRKTAEGRFLVRNRAALLEAATAILCVSEFIREELIRRGYPASRLITHRLGIDLATIEPGPPAASRRGVLYAGRLVEKKGIRFLLEAWRLLPPALQRQGLTIIGAGPERAHVESLLGALPDVTLLGAQPHDQLVAAMRRHRVFAFPSVRATNGDAEGLPIVGMEAQACGTPVVAFRDGPAAEMLEHERSGLLVEARRPDLLAEALAAVLGSDDLANRLGRGGPAVAAERFDLRASHDALEALYDRFAATTLRAGTAARSALATRTHA